MNDMILYTEKSQRLALKKLLGLVNKFSKVAGYNTNMQKSLALSEREIKTTMHLE